MLRGSCAGMCMDEGQLQGWAVEERGPPRPLCLQTMHCALPPLHTPTQVEEYLIALQHSEHGSHWSTMARYLPGRTDNSLKNHFKCVHPQPTCPVILSHPVLARPLCVRLDPLRLQLCPARALCLAGLSVLGPDLGHGT